MSQQNLATGAVEIMNRVRDEKLAKSNQEITLDGSNKVAFPGFPYRFEALHEKVLVSVDIFKSGYECKECAGTGKIETKGKFIPGTGPTVVLENCTKCNGTGVWLELPENAKNLPTTGIVVSMGKVAKEKADYKIGDRILFGMYAGTMIPTKAGIMFKYMDWNLGVIRIEGAEDMSAFDFILQTDE